MNVRSPQAFPSPSRWARIVAGALLAGALAVLVWGRGGTVVLVGATLAFLALAVLLLSVPDGDPGAA